jgi:hypothetical protein
MNTPSHAILNLALLTQKTVPLPPIPHSRGCYFAGCARLCPLGLGKTDSRLPESGIWTETYLYQFLE